MAERPIENRLTTNELIVRKLKETFNRDGNIFADRNGTNVWVMTAAAKPFSESQESDHEQQFGEQKPSHRVRVVLRTTDANAGTNPYADGSDFFLSVEEQRQTAEFVWEDENFAEAPPVRGFCFP